MVGFLEELNCRLGHPINWHTKRAETLEPAIIRGHKQGGGKIEIALSK